MVVKMTTSTKAIQNFYVTKLFRCWSYATFQQNSQQSASSMCQHTDLLSAHEASCWLHSGWGTSSHVASENLSITKPAKQAADSPATREDLTEPPLRSSATNSGTVTEDDS